MMKDEKQQATEEMTGADPVDETKLTENPDDIIEGEAGEAEGIEEIAEEAPEEEWAVPKEELIQIIEGMLFVSGRVLTADAISKAIPDVTVMQTRTVLRELVEIWNNPAKGIHLQEINKGYQFRSDIICAPYIREMLKARPTRLSRQALETLSIIAYRQPLTRADIEDIRGVDSGGVTKTLLEKKLIKILGKREEPGRPLIYGTSKEFLETFNMRTLTDLPTLQEYQELSEEHQAVVDSTFSRDEVDQAEQEQDKLFQLPDIEADNTSTSKELQSAAEELEMASRSADETVNEVLSRIPYDEEEEEEEGEAVAQVEVLAGPVEQADSEGTGRKPPAIDLEMDMMNNGPDSDDALPMESPLEINLTDPKEDQGDAPADLEEDKA